jgi:hypothetical protein
MSVEITQGDRLLICDWIWQIVKGIATHVQRCGFLGLNVRESADPTSERVRRILNRDILLQLLIVDSVRILCSSNQTGELIAI